MKTITQLGLAAVLALSMTFSASALDIYINPDSGNLNATRWEGVEGPGQAAIDAAIAAFIGNSVELYKSDAAGNKDGVITPQEDSGPLSTSYTTVFNPDVDPTAAIITHNGGAFVGPTAYLLVKDGNAVPVWYLFDLTAIFDWNGTDTLNLSGFWENVTGSISHVTLYGTTNGVPDGGMTILLLGAALTGLGFARRKLRKM